MVRFLAATSLIISSLLAAPLAAQSSREEEQRILEERRQSNPRYQADQQRALEQAQLAMNYYRPLVVLLTYDKKCGELNGLDKLTVVSAELAHTENRTALLRLGAMTPEQEQQYEGQVKEELDKYSCEDLASSAGVANAMKHADFHRDVYLLALLEYDGGTNPDSLEFSCSLSFRNQRPQIITAGYKAKERLSQNPNFPNIKAIARERAQRFTVLCETTENDFIFDPFYQLMQQFEELG